MPKADNHHTPSRRRLLSGSAATLLAGTAAITVARAATLEATGDDAELDPPLPRVHRGRRGCERLLWRRHTGRALDELLRTTGKAHRTAGPNS